MIRSIYKKNVPSTGIRILWACLNFFVINFFIFFAFMNICFQNLVENPPEAVTATLLSILGVDLIWFIVQAGKIFSINNLIDFIILITLLVSFILSENNNNSWPVYLQVFVLIKLKDAYYFKGIAYQLMKKDRLTFRLFIILKIIYFIILIGHITGCIFYLIDNTLIEQQYFGSLADNPGLYYQGSLHVFSPIYGLSQLQRYVYAIYFTFSLLSTVAFGDIIPKNYFQNVYVSILLIGATIGIAFIIQQMYIVFRNQKNKKYQLMQNKIKYVSEYLRSQKHINRQFRYQLINYMVDSQWKQLTQTPNLKLLTKQMLSKVLSNSLLCQEELPQLIKQYFLTNMSSKYYPANYKLIDNNSIHNHLFGTIIIEAPVKIGYTEALIGLKQYHKNVFGFQQLILSTNYYHRHLNVILASQAQQLYQIAKDKIISQSKRESCIYCQVQDHTLMNCKQCHYVPETSYSDLYEKHYYQKRQYQERRPSVKSFKITSFKSPQHNKDRNQLKDAFYSQNAALQKNMKLKDIYGSYISKLLQFNERPHLQSIQKYSQWKFYNDNFNL